MRKNKRNSDYFFSWKRKKKVFSDSRQVSTRSTSILRKLPPRSLLSLFHNRLKFFWSSILISLQLCFFTRYLPDLLTYKKHYFVETLAHEYDKGVSGLKTCIDCLFLASRRKLWKFEFSHLFVLNHISTSEKNPVTSQKPHDELVKADCVKYGSCDWFSASA